MTTQDATPADATTGSTTTGSTTTDSSDSIRIGDDTGAEGAAMTSIHRVILRSFAAMNAHDPATLAAGYREDALVSDPQYPQPLRGREAIEQDIADFVTAFPDLHLELLGSVIEGSSFAARARMTGTHEGPIATADGEMGATHKRVELLMSLHGRCDEDGQIVEEHRFYDTASLLAQLGGPQ